MAVGVATGDDEVGSGDEGEVGAGVRVLVAVCVPVNVSVLVNVGVLVGVKTPGVVTVERSCVAVGRGVVVRDDARVVGEGDAVSKARAVTGTGVKVVRGFTVAVSSSTVAGARAGVDAGLAPPKGSSCTSTSGVARYAVGAGPKVAACRGPASIV